MRPGESGYAAALAACLRELPDTMTLPPERVTVLAAWPAPDDGFCIIYRHPYHPGRRLGYRAKAEPGGEHDSPESFGFDVANFAVSEPLGAVADLLRRDTEGVEWHGTLEEDLPRAPAE